ncbi:MULTISPECIES: hypothetical protein, partial [Rhizobium/Agrobacterium group]|uniref:hypothetical protein n=1 Tax=Rhizobium/Agrobacterium group TaxID=227290 RepID=UPI001AEEDA61
MPDCSFAKKSHAASTHAIAISRLNSSTPRSAKNVSKRRQHWRYQIIVESLYPRRSNSRSRSTTNADKATITNISNHRPDTVPGQVINLSVIMRSVYVQEPNKTAPATKHCAFYSAGHK